jgi:transcriptional regulator with GAF, ATPase, and Fis domain
MENRLPQKTVWLQNFVSIKTKELDRFTEIFNHNAIKTTQWNHQDKSVLGIITFDSPFQINNILSFIKDAIQHEQDRIIVISFIPDLLRSDVVWKFLKAGAMEVLDFENTFKIHEVILEKYNRCQTVDSLLKCDYVKKNLVGKSLIWRKTLREMIEIATFTNSSVLILGESGTGKEMISRLIHTLDARREKGDLVLVDCTTISPELSGSEFYGHEKGAFTGAFNSREGAFSLANRGTLFLDEIGELPSRMQAELLRVIQEGTYKKVGSNVWQKTIFRLVSATNRNLKTEIESGNFRLDLFYRISAWTCQMPPLNQRKEDIPLLAEYFLAKNYSNEREIPKIDDLVYDYLMNREYPGNVREIAQLMNRIACKHVGKGIITLGDVPSGDYPQSSFEENTTEWQSSEYRTAIQRAIANGMNLKDIKEAAAETAISLAMESENGRVHKAAQILGVTDRALQIRKSMKVNCA